MAGSTLHGKCGIEKVAKKFLNKFYEVTQLEGLKVKQVCCSDYVTIVLMENGEVHQLGGSGLLDKSQIPADPNEITQVAGLEQVQCVDVACGDYHGCAIDELGDVYTWGGGKTPQYNKG